MAYVSGIMVDVPHQAVRPREPARPSRSETVRSPEMASRQLRPRETPWTLYNGMAGLGLAFNTLPAATLPSTKPATKPTVSTSNAAAVEASAQQAGNALGASLLKKISALKGQQAALEKLLKGMGVMLSRFRAEQQQAGARNDRAGVATAQARVLAVQQEIAHCISAIKLCAAQANQAANGAIATGVSREDTQIAANVPASSANIAKPQVLLPSAVQLVVESNSGGVTPGGEIVLGPPSSTTPPSITVTPSIEPAVLEPTNLTVKDVTVSSGSIGTFVFVGGLVGLAYMVLRKKGHA